MVAGLLNWDYEFVRDPEKYSTYLEDRTTLEMAFSALRGRGLVSISSLVSDRCAKYFDLYVRQCHPKKKDKMTWRQMCWREGLTVSQASNQTFVSVQDVRNAAAMESGGVGSDETDIGSMDIDIERLYRGIYGYLSKSSRDVIEIYGQARFIKDMEALREGTEIEACAHTDKVSPKLFEEPVPLQTLTELHSRTIHMSTKEDYNYLAVVAETGDWLLRAPFKEILKAKEDLHIYLIAYLIAAFAVNCDALRREFGGANEPRAAIYFTRRRRSFFVAPVYLDNSTDLANLLKSFYMYWQRALHGASHDRRADPGRISRVVRYAHSR